MAKLSLKFILGADTTRLRGDLSRGEAMLKRFRGVAASLGGVLAGAFAIGRITSFIKSATAAAAAGEGIRKAFERLKDPSLLNNLRSATGGTVSDLNLMKAAVKASNFKIPLEQMGKLLRFAQQRALETGESVDYLVESIITGIARKSLPILDNLGLSTVEIRSEFEKTGDMAAAVGNIIDRDMGPPMVTAQTLIDKMNASWQNFSERVGVRVLNVSKQIVYWLDRNKKTSSDATQYIRDFNVELAKERLTLNSLFGELRRTTVGTKERANAIDEINRRYGNYLKNQLNEKSNLSDINTAQTEANRNLIKAIALRVKQADIEQRVASAVAKQQAYVNKALKGAKTTESLQPAAMAGFERYAQFLANNGGSARALSSVTSSFIGEFGNAAVSNYDAVYKAFKGYYEESIKSQRTLNGLNEYYLQLVGEINSAMVGGGGGGTGGGGGSDDPKSKKPTDRGLLAYASATKSMNLGGIHGLVTEMEDANEAATEFTATLTEMNHPLGQQSFLASQAADAWREWKMTINETQAAHQAFTAAAMAGYGEQEEGLKGMLKTTYNVARDIIFARLAEGLASVVSSAVVGLPFPANILAAAAAGGAFAGIFNAAVPQLATGGIIPPGFPNDSYPALLSSGETVVPKPKALGAMTSNIRVSGVIFGENIKIANDKANYRNSRVRGY